MTPTIDEIRQKVSASMSRRGVVRASVFGSVARGEATGRSDVDFLVEFEKGRTLVDLSGLRLDLCEVLGRDVDIATPGSLHPKLRDQILKELVPVL
jgi:predicted nucleotidyltransferase